MTRCQRVGVALAGIAAFALTNNALAQIRPHSDTSRVNIAGTVEAASGKLISIRTGASVFTFRANDQTVVWKGSMFHDLSPVAKGDDLFATCRNDEAGDLVAETIWLNMVNAFGVVNKVNRHGFEMLASSSSQEPSAHAEAKKLVWVDSDTVFNASAKEDLKVGRHVYLMGVGLKNGTLKAIRLTVYDQR